MGISADLAVHYVRAGWLNRLARGVFSRPGESLSLHACLLLLERRIEGLHVGGKLALKWYSVRHYLSQQESLHLFGWAAAVLPNWFQEQFPSEYHRKRLFREEPAALLHVTPFENRAGAPRVSSPERALLELLSEVGVREGKRHKIQATLLFVEPQYGKRGTASSTEALGPPALLSVGLHGACQGTTNDEYFLFDRSGEFKSPTTKEKSMLLFVTPHAPRR